MTDNVCADNRNELIAKYKTMLMESTNIETSPEEMAVIDNILFRFWQMGWLDTLETILPSVKQVDCEVNNMDDYIKREDAIAHPFANGKYDKEHAEPAFVRGCETYREWLEQLPVVCLPCIEWHDAKTDPPKQNGRYLVVWGETDNIETLSYALNLEEIDDWDFANETHPGWFSFDTEYGYYEVTADRVKWWAELPEKPKEREK